MKHTVRVFTLLSAILFLNLLPAQNADWCSSDRYLKQRIKTDAQAAQKWEEFKSSRQQLVSGEGSRAANDVIYIPVVFHIIYDNDAIGSGENITDAQVLSQIDALNLYFSYQDPGIATVPGPFKSLVADCKIQFCLAKFDENGIPSSGIIRHPFPAKATWDSETDIDNTLKPATAWNSSRYLNIWSVRMGGQLLTDGILAYATFPGFGAANEDGIVSRYTNIGTIGSVLPTYNRGKTITHEVGHWLGLLHIWGFDANCNDVGDFISDTPDQADLNFGCPNYPSISCSNGPNGDMFMNYMDYTRDNCSSMFTIDQAQAMRNTLDGARATIKTSTSACFYNLDAAVAKIGLPTDTVCSLTFSPAVLIRNEGTTTITSGKFYLQIDGGGTQIINWNGSIGLLQETQITLPAQTVTDGAHTLAVTFANVNGQTSDGFSGNDSKNVAFIAYDAGPSAALPFTEDFESGFPASNWSVNNPNNDITWLQNTNYGGYESSFQSASINNLGYSSNPTGKRDGLITDVYDFTGTTYPELKFDVAYVQHSINRSDSLNLYYSLDCGSNWIKIWNQNGAQLATDSNQTTLFLPDATQWKTVSVPLVAIGPQRKVSFKFENVTDWGNVLYLDNINIQNNPALSAGELKKQDVKVFPNPAGNLVGVRLPANHSFEQLQLLNSTGELVYETGIDSDALIFSVEDLSSGLYLVHLKGANSSQTEKLLISK
ncbi:MAG: M43 family zinc metalloprotease [Bacteroidota bacterium]